MICLFCDRLEFTRLWDVWEGGEFQIDTCCEGMREEAIRYMNDEPKEAAAWLQTLPLGCVLDEDDDGEGCEPILPAIFPEGLRRVHGEDGQLLLDCNLQIEPVAWAEAKAFVNVHHRHCRAPAGWRYGAAIRNGSQRLGVVCVGRPVARAFDASQVVEVNRLCVRTDIASGLRWNACSMLYGWAAREAKKRGFKRVITYTLATEQATTLKAAGWALDGTLAARSRGWRGGVPISAKTRWARDL